MNRRVLRMLRQLLAVARRNKIALAIGGGVAVNVYGHVRETRDVDSFFRLRDRLRVMRALRQEGFLIERLFAPFHYAAFPPDARDPRTRIDLMFPAGDPELAAIRRPTLLRVKEWKIDLPVFPVELLIIAKLQAAEDIEGERHAADVRALMELGAFDPEKMRRQVARFDRSLLPTFERIARLPRCTRRPRKKGRAG